jgi:hypothetical protein
LKLTERDTGDAKRQAQAFEYSTCMVDGVKRSGQVKEDQGSSIAAVSGRKNVGKNT